MTGPTRGWWNMTCWNGLSAEQQEELVMVGVLEIGYEPEGECPRGAAVAIETMHDVAPGPRFYCAPCAIVYIAQRATEDYDRRAEAQDTGHDRRS